MNTKYFEVDDTLVMTFNDEQVEREEYHRDGIST